MVKNFIFRIIIMLIVGNSLLHATKEENDVTLPFQKHYKNIIFDLGGVLVEWNPIKFINQIFGENVPVHQKMLHIFSSDDTRNRLTPLWIEMDRGTSTIAQAAQKISQEFTLDKNDVEHFIQQVFSRCMARIDKGFYILEEVKKAGYKVYALSNFSREGFDIIEQKYEISSNFDGITLSAWEKCIKPEKEIYDRLLQKHNLKAEECLFIDDMSVNVQAAMALGIDGIVCSDHDFVQQELERLGVLKSMHVQTTSEEVPQM